MILSRAPLTEQAPRVRLACIRHAASVRPEPGSNSSLYDFSDRNRSGTPHNPHIVMVRCIRKARQIKTSTPKAVLARFYLVVTVYRVGETERLAFEPIDYTTLGVACQTLRVAV